MRHGGMWIGLTPTGVTNLMFEAVILHVVVLCAEIPHDEIGPQMISLLQSDSDSDKNTPDRLQPSRQDCLRFGVVANGYEENVTLAEMRADVLARGKNLRQGILLYLFSAISIK